MKQTAKTRVLSLLVLILLSALALIGVERADAQQVPTITQMQIQLWPEYDRAAMLVQYTGQVDTEGEIPLTFTLPETATLHVTAYVDPANGLVELPNQVDGSTVGLISPNGTFHVEFYDALDTSKAEREYRFTWSGDYDVTSLQLTVQIPPSATDITITPLADGPTQGADGLDYYTVDQIGVARGSEATITMRYRKADAALTAGEAPETSVPDEASESGGGGGIVPLITAIVVGLGVIGAAAYVYMQRKPPSKPTQRGTTKPQVKITEPKAGAVKFCTQCGAAVPDASDKFCRKCGASLR